MAKNIQIRKSSTIELRDISSYKLVIEAVNPQNMTDKIFLNQRIRNFAKNTVEDTFAAVCTPTQLEDFAEDKPAEGSSYYRTNTIQIVVRTPEMLNTAFESILYEVKKLVADLDALENLGDVETYTVASPITLKGIAVYNTQQLANLTTAEIQEVDNLEITQLSTAQIKVFTTSSIAALSSSNISVLSTDQISAMSSAQIAAIETGDISALNTSQVQALNSLQIQGLSPAQLLAMEPVDIASINADFISLLSTAQIKVLTTTELAALSLVQVANLTTTQKAVLSQAQLAAIPQIPQFPTVVPPSNTLWLDQVIVPGNVATVVDLNNFANNLIRANIGNAASWNIEPYSNVNGQGVVVYDNRGIKFNVQNISSSLSRAVLSFVYKNDASNPNRPGKDAQGYQYPYIYVTSLTGTISGKFLIKLNNQLVLETYSGAMPSDTVVYYPFDETNFGAAGRIAPNQVTPFIIELEATGTSASFSGELFLAYD